MSFFLLGKDPAGELHLISSAVHKTRQDALSELSHLTADPGFPYWDADVLVMELESGTSVLLVRPTPRADETAVPELPAIENEEPLALVDEESTAAAEPVDDVLAHFLDGLSEDPVAHEEVTDPVFADVREDALVVAANTPDAEPAVEPDAGERKADDPDDALREAIMRTAVHMESEGIVAPDSIGAEVPADGSSPESTAGAPAWPWDTKGSEAPFPLDALEEPAHAVTPLVTAAGDEETMAVSRPMILGSYGEPPVVDEAEEPAQDLIAVNPTNEEPAPLSEVADASDFILDLDPVEESSPSMSAATDDFEVASELKIAGEFEADEAVSAADMSCDDCVYVQSCPNKDQRDPKIGRAHV